MIFSLSRSTKYSIVHFFHSDFRRCKIIDQHLETLAQKHFDTKVIRVNVEKAPFLVERLNVRVLPCLISFIDGKSVDRLEGFEKLGNTDDFMTPALESYFLAAGVFQRAKTTGDMTRSIVETDKQGEEGDDDDWD